jgi:hypothetical protein
MADLLIGYLQNIGLYALGHSCARAGQPAPHEAAVHAALPQPMFGGNFETHASHCRVDEEFRTLVSDAQVAPVLAARRLAGLASLQVCPWLESSVMSDQS